MSTARSISQLEGKTDEEVLSFGAISFRDFYLLNTGINVGRGFALCVPSDRARLSQIKARFVLVPEGSVCKTDDNL